MRLALLVALSLAGSLALSPAARAQTTLGAGDLAIVQFDTQTGVKDGFSFFAFRALAAGTVIKFTDRGWTPGSPGTFFAGEPPPATPPSMTTFTVPAGGLAAGAVVRYINDGTGTGTAGFAPSASAFGTLEATGDQILAYQGTDAAPVFLYAVTIPRVPGGRGWITAGTVDAFSSYLPTGLVDGATAASLGFRNSAYTGPTTGPKSALLAAISTRHRWTGNDTPNVSTTSALTYTLLANVAVSTAGTAAGWRVLGVPKRTTAHTVATLSALSLVQGLQDEFSTAAVNLYTGYNGKNTDITDTDGTGPRRANNKGFRPPLAETSALTPGRVVFVR